MRTIQFLIVFLTMFLISDSCRQKASEEGERNLANVLEGVMMITGTPADGSPLTAIPNYARNNREYLTDMRNFPGSMVWINE